MMGDEKAPAVVQAGNLPNAEYRRFEGMREYEAMIDGLIPQTQRIIRVFDRTPVARRGIHRSATRRCASSCSRTARTAC